jgi:hypothetical protein
MGKKRKSKQKAQVLMREPSFMRNRDGIEVAIFSDARPSDERLQHVIQHLLEFAEIDQLRKPVRKVDVEIGGRVQRAQRLMDGIDQMHEARTIDDVQLIAAREYQEAFTRAQYARYGTVLPNQVPGGSLPVSDAWIVSRLRATQKLDMLSEYAEMAGVRAGYAVYSIAGMGLSARRLAQVHGRHHEYWTSQFVCGLSSIVSGYLQAERRGKLGLPGQPAENRLTPCTPRL